jgi:crotonobetainyl-CoA:carnitine CoA-transferase CaiB-like acyl-CoA transferase
VLGVPSDDRWDDFVDAVGCEEVREYGTNRERRANREEVIGAIQDRLNEEPASHWADVLDEANFPNGPLNDISEVVDHPQAEARELFARIEDRGVDLMLPNHPLHFPDHDAVGVRGPAPDLGEHTDSVFGEVAGDQTTLDEWREGGAFGD